MGFDWISSITEKDVKHDMELQDNQGNNDYEIYCRKLEDYAKQGFVLLQNGAIDQAKQICSRGEELYEELKILFMTKKIKFDESNFMQVFTHIANVGEPIKKLRVEFVERFPEE